MACELLSILLEMHSKRFVAQNRNIKMKNFNSTTKIFFGMALVLTTVGIGVEGDTQLAAAATVGKIKNVRPKYTPRKKLTRIQDGQRHLIYQPMRSVTEKRQLEKIESLPKRRPSALSKQEVSTFRGLAQKNEGNFQEATIEMKNGQLSGYEELHYRTTREQIIDGIYTETTRGMESSVSSHLVTKVLYNEKKDREKYKLTNISKHTAGVAAVEYARSRGKKLEDINDVRVTLLSAGHGTPEAQFLAEFRDQGDLKFGYLVGIKGIGSQRSRDTTLKATTYEFGELGKQGEIRFFDPFMNSPEAMDKGTREQRKHK